MSCSFPFDWVDAFTDTPFGGNGCAVVHDGGAVDVETCLKYTRETGLVECTFVGPSDVADAKVRYFFPTMEIPFAGHPTIASVASLLSRGVVKGPSLTLETGAGVVPIEVSPDGLITMTQNAPVFGDEVSPGLIARLSGLSDDDIIGQPQVVSTGLPFCIVALKSHDALRKATLDLDVLPEFQKGLTVNGVQVMEPYFVALGGATDAGDSFGRLLLAPPSPPEDPFTGSATGCAASYLWKHGLIDRPRYVAQQGHDLGRPGQAQVEVLGPRDAISGVKVSGQGRIVMAGEVHF
ncbi:PhzF family phenazine biosynthesis protein [uncultured Litoreibacter sp.]|uniref:PhzF family phenazine biosynthesis protein n=1 Tax=uncultured Litoreibacter sp. TaxID=1392394 RepID=UPI002633666F|nr:PhzF family phenazine biosynthesis protein [uncultured Litoreibacter sp.]